MARKQVHQPGHGELGRIEIFGSGQKRSRGAGVRARHGADLLQIGCLVAAGEGHVVFLAVAPDPDLQVAGQRVDHRHAHAVQTAGEAVVAVGELAAGVEVGQDHLDPGHALLGVDVHRHAAAVVGSTSSEPSAYRMTVIVAGMAGQGLVDAVVDDLLGQVVGAGGVGVHPRALAHRVEAAQDFNG